MYVWAYTTKFTNVRIAGLGKSRYLIREEICSSTMKPRLRAEWVVLTGQMSILASCCLSPMRRNSVLEELRVRRLAVIQEEICYIERSEGE